MILDKDDSCGLMNHSARKESERIKNAAPQTLVVDSVNHRLAQWRDYHEHRSSSTPGKAYSAADRVANAIFQARRPMLSIRTPDPKVDLNVSPQAILRAYNKAQKGDKYIF
mgnify:CR=1 FL=1